MSPGKQARLVIVAAAVTGGRFFVCVAGAVLFAVSTARAADNIGVLGSRPKWEVLEAYQETITRDQFVNLLDHVYCTHGRAGDLFQVGEKTVRILQNRAAQKFFTLRFAPNDEKTEPVPCLWRSARSLGPAQPEQPLAGLKIALDPGHLGGSWAKMEERWMKVGDNPPVTEGDMTLRVARLLAPKLREMGATVQFVRKDTEPVTLRRPDDFSELARKILVKNGVPSPRADVLDPKDPEKEHTIRWQSEILFYRYAEIRRRAFLVNAKLHPDLVVCLHFNAEKWDDPNNPTFVDRNHLHLLVNGSYLQDELELDDERFEMTRRLLSRAYDEELPLSESVATTMAKATGLPAFQYPTTVFTTKIGQSGYVYARNLLATRLYRCPVVYCEPYVMNSKAGFDRMIAGDYEGTRSFEGVERKSIFREYADSVAEGLADYYKSARGK